MHYNRTTSALLSELRVAQQSNVGVQISPSGLITDSEARILDHMAYKYKKSVYKVGKWDFLSAGRPQLRDLGDVGPILPPTYLPPKHGVTLFDYLLQLQARKPAFSKDQVLCPESLTSTVPALESFFLTSSAKCPLPIQTLGSSMCESAGNNEGVRKFPSIQESNWGKLTGGVVGRS